MSEWEWARAPPPPRPVWLRAALCLYDPATRSVLGRDAKRWGILLVFYGVFYAGLALLFGACMGGLMLTLDEDAPAHTLAASLIGDSPGVSAMPRDALRANHSEELARFLEPYEAAAWFRALTGCKPADRYGAPDAPCLYVKLNRVFGWRPDYYDELPEDAPEELRAHVAALPPPERRQVWVSCRAEGAPDAPMQYPWGRGLPDRFFPYRNQREYLSPLVAVRVPAETDSRAVRCRAWARNVRHEPSLKEPRGYARVLL